MIPTLPVAIQRVEHLLAPAEICVQTLGRGSSPSGIAIVSPDNPLRIFEQTAAGLAERSNARHHFRVLVVAGAAEASALADQIVALKSSLADDGVVALACEGPLRRWLMAPLRWTVRPPDMSGAWTREVAHTGLYRSGLAMTEIRTGTAGFGSRFLLGSFNRFEDGRIRDDIGRTLGEVEL